MLKDYSWKYFVKTTGNVQKSVSTFVLTQKWLLQLYQMVKHSSARLNNIKGFTFNFDI